MRLMGKRGRPKADERPERELDPWLVELGERIASARLAAGFTSRPKLARQLGVGVDTLGYWERGEREPSLRSAREIAELCRVSLDYLVLGKPGESPAVHRWLRSGGGAVASNEAKEWIRSLPLRGLDPSPTLIDRLVLLWYRSGKKLNREEAVQALREQIRLSEA